MTMSQQTAVGYIISQLRQLAFNKNTHLGMGDVRVTQGLIDELEEQGKQIEKEQIIDAWREGDNDSMYSDKELDQQAEQYYNETYNK